MRYISTRDNFSSVPPAETIRLGMVPEGGLFVPESVPKVSLEGFAGAAYRDAARRIMTPLLSDFKAPELDHCLRRAYNPETFDTQSVVELHPLEGRRHILELWHGPTAAFKDVALQIMPHFLADAKAKSGDRSHTLILVATSGDTGKAALEGFKNAAGISIVVFYPHGGVSEIQMLQMTTTDGANTHVAAVKGNFDDCQAGVKALFGDAGLRDGLAGRSIVFSSANSINWGRLCPQIVYYFYAYFGLVGQGAIRTGGEVDFCVPTGNFGNILAGYYAREMGLPIRKLICASNRNHILTDFFRTGVYDTNREFHKTSSPSMDILVSSNLERFLFEVTGHDAGRVRGWFEQLKRTGRFEVDGAARRAMAALIVPGWADEPRVFAVIGETFRKTGYVLDTHTAVAVAVSEEAGATGDGVPMIIASTANPYKFSSDVLAAISGEPPDDEFRSIERLHELTGLPVHRAVRGLREKLVRHRKVIEISGMREAVLEIADGIGAAH